MNVPLSKELCLFIIAAIPATHDELCLSKIQNSIFERAANPTISFPEHARSQFRGGHSCGEIESDSRNTAEKRLRMHQIMKIWRGI